MIPIGGDDVPVVAAVVVRDGRYLLGKRPRGKRHGGLWEFPGGKMRRGETVAQAVRRELLEELALTAECGGEVRFRARDPGSPFLILFVDATARGEPTAREHTEVGWWRPEELPDLPLAPSDALFVREKLDGY